MVDTFYRIVQSEAPTAEDFRTQKELGSPLLNPAFEREWAEGISVYSDLAFTILRARNNTTDLGRYVVPLRMPEGSDIEVRQTTRNRHHYTIYADRERALALVCGPAIHAFGYSID